MQLLLLAATAAAALALTVRGASLLPHAGAAAPRQRARDSQALIEAVQRRYEHLSHSQAVAYSHTLAEHYHAMRANTSEWEAREAAERRALARARVAFNCSALPPSDSEPTNVNQLRPADIKWAAALGDSLVAAFGALSRSIIDIRTEWRAVSYAGGGTTDAEQLTVPNMLRHYNADVRGGATGSGSESSAAAQANQAVSGAKVCDTKSQVDALLARFDQLSPAARNEWKVVTIMVGPNNLCAYCNDRDAHSPARIHQCMREALQHLRDQTTKTFVNLIGAFDVTKLYEITEGSCRSLHNFACPCGVDSSPDVRDEVRQAAGDYNKAFASLAAELSGERSDFEVVFQPWVVETDVPRRDDGRPDTRYLAPDCFHFSGIAHVSAAIATWTNMFEAHGDKTPRWFPGEQAKCPTQAAPFLRTAAN